MTPTERAALWREDYGWPQVGHLIDDSGDGIYGYSPGGRPG